MKKWICILTAMVLLAGMCSCSGKEQGSPKNPTQTVVLTERQKKILTDNGLSPEYDELTTSQQSAIDAIEKMLVYLENKYGLAFSYEAYLAPFAMEQEQLMAYPSAGPNQSDCVTVTTTKDGYHDDYVAVASTDLFASYVANGLSELHPGIVVQVYPQITKTYLEMVPERETELDGNVESSLVIFVDANTCSESEFQELQSNFENWMRQHELYGIVRLLRLKEDTIQYLTKYNYVDYLGSEYCDSDLNFSIQK